MSRIGDEEICEYRTGALVRLAIPALSSPDSTKPVYWDGERIDCKALYSRLGLEGAMNPTRWPREYVEEIARVSGFTPAEIRQLGEHDALELLGDYGMDPRGLYRDAVYATVKDRGRLRQICDCAPIELVDRLAMELIEQGLGEGSKFVAMQATESGNRSKVWGTRGNSVFEYGLGYGHWDDCTKAFAKHILPCVARNLKNAVRSKSVDSITFQRFLNGMKVSAEVLGVDI